MIKSLVLLTMLFLTGCFYSNTIMTRDIYDEVAVGMPIADITAQAGQPRDIRSRGSDVEEYEYIERIKVQAQPDHFSIENVYYIDVLHGIVVGKRMVTNRMPAYIILYDTQPNYAAP